MTISVLPSALQALRKCTEIPPRRSATTETSCDTGFPVIDGQSSASDANEQKEPSGAPGRSSAGRSFFVCFCDNPSFLKEIGRAAQNMLGRAAIAHLDKAGRRVRRDIVFYRVVRTDTDLDFFPFPIHKIFIAAFGIAKPNALYDLWTVDFDFDFDLDLVWRLVSIFFQKWN